MVRKFALVVVGVLLLLGACGGGVTVVEEDFVWPGGENPFYEETLTIAVAAGISGTLRNFARAYMSANPGVTVEIIDYSRNAEAVQRGREEVGIQLMAGTAPVLIDGMLVDYLTPGTRQLFADWRPIMAAHPHFDQENYFYAVFDATAIDGRTYSFPLNANMAFVFHNATVPEVVSAMAGRRGITIAEIMEISAGVGDGMGVDSNFSVLYAVLWQLYRFFDMETGRVDFATPEFIELITAARAMTTPRNNFDWTWAGSGLDDWRRLAGQYHFRIDSALMREVYGIFQNDFGFGGPVPLINEQGEIPVAATLGFVLNGGATYVQQALALDFMRFITEVPPLDPYADEQDPQVMHLRALFLQIDAGVPPVSRSHFALALAEQQPFVIRNFWTTHGWRLINNWRLVEEGGLIAEHMTAAMTPHLEAPMTRGNSAPAVVTEAITEILLQFHNGHITAEAAANDLQNRVTLIMLEAQ